MKSALLQVGINQYPNAPLNGCVNDVLNVAAFLADQRKLRFTQEHRLLDQKATKQAIEEGVRWLVNTQAELMLCQISGHGTQIPDLNADESDRMDEAFVPVDYETAGVISDDWLRQQFSRVQPGKRLIVWIDACHSGTMTRSLVNALTPGPVKATFNLSSPRYLPPGRIPVLKEKLRQKRGLRISKNLFGAPKAIFGPPKGVSYVKENVIGLKACQDHQTAADAWIAARQQYCGAATHYILEAMSMLGASATFEQIAALATKRLKAARYSQNIQFTGTKAALKQPFI